MRVFDGGVAIIFDDLEFDIFLFLRFSYGRMLKCFGDKRLNCG